MHGLNMYDFHARQYDALFGRFHAMDPMADSISLYVYCTNNPMRITDPTGMDSYENGKVWTNIGSEYLLYNGVFNDKYYYR